MCSLYTAVLKMKAKCNLFVNPTGSVHHQPASCIRTKGESAWYVRWKVQAIQGSQVHNKGWSFSDQDVNFGSSIEAVHQSNTSVSVAVLYHNHTELNILGYEAVFLQSNFCTLSFLLHVFTLTSVLQNNSARYNSYWWFKCMTCGSHDFVGTISPIQSK